MTHEIKLKNITVIYRLSRKSPAIFNITRMFVQHRCKLAAKENGLEVTCVNNDDFTILVSGGGRCC